MSVISVDQITLNPKRQEKNDMPLQLSVGLSKKRGLPDYGSIGAACSVTVELDGSLLNQDLESFHHQVKRVKIWGFHWLGLSTW